MTDKEKAVESWPASITVLKPSLPNLYVVGPPERMQPGRTISFGGSPYNLASP